MRQVATVPFYIWWNRSLERSRQWLQTTQDIVEPRYRVLGLPWWLRWERICLQCRRPGFNPWVGKAHGRREWLPTPIFLAGESHGQRSLVGYSPWGCEELDMTVQLTHTQSLESRLLTCPTGLSIQIKWGRRDGTFCYGCSCFWLRDREGGDRQSWSF